MASNDVYTHRSFFEDNVEVPNKTLADFLSGMAHFNASMQCKIDEIDGNCFSKLDVKVTHLNAGEYAFISSDISLVGDVIKERKKYSDLYDKIMNKTLRRL